MDHSQYLGIFLDEARDFLQLLNERLLFLENHRDDRKTFDEIFRAAHTLKGMAATMGFSGLAELTHQMENLLDAVRKGDLALDTPLTDTLFACVDAVGTLIEASAEDRPQTAPGVLLERLAGALDPAPGKAPTPGPATRSAERVAWPDLDPFELAVAAEAQSRGYRTVWVGVRLAEGCLLKGVRAYMVVTALEQIGELIKASPPVPDLEEERFEAEFAVLLVSHSDDAVVRDKLDDISEVAAVTLCELAVLDPEGSPEQASEPAAVATIVEAAVPEPPAAGLPAPGSWQARTVPPESPSPPAPPPARSPITGRPETAPAASEPARLEPRGAEASRSPGTPAGAAADRIAPTVRVSTERLDSLVNLVGELVIDRTRLQQVGLKLGLIEIEDVIRHVGSVITDIHGVVMKLRMMPVERVFSRFPRMVRDLGRELGKEVQLVVEGQETELDRLMIDEIADPLLHLLRNAVDHGLESSLERELLGKSGAGTIWLRARHEGNHVIIEVQDDGRGMDPDKLRRRAVDKGLLLPEEAGRLTEKQALDLIFTPGFSTRDQATDISGRGVGMDAVKSKAVALGGALDINTTLGKGTLVTFILPLTLAIIQCMLTEVGDEIYAIPINFIDDAHDYADLTVQTVQEQEIALLRGQSLLLQRLRRILAVPVPRDRGGSSASGQDEAAVVVVRVGSRRSGLVVDRLLGQQEVVIKPISKLAGTLRHISGASILGDGRLALILDAATLL